jgi:hypothetical protein
MRAEAENDLCTISVSLPARSADSDAWKSSAVPAPSEGGLVMVRTVEG